jgi:hypothetical protein
MKRYKLKSFESNCNLINSRFISKCINFSCDMCDEHTNRIRRRWFLDIKTHTYFYSTLEKEEGKSDVIEIDNSMTTHVVNIKYSPYDVLIDRITIWGNPFRIGIDGTRDECCDKYEEYVLNHPLLLQYISRLKGKRLGCHCHPYQRCHGEILAEYAENENQRHLSAQTQSSPCILSNARLSNTKKDS